MGDTDGGIAHIRHVLILLKKTLTSYLQFAYHTIDIEETLRSVLGGENLDLVKKV